MRRVPKEFRRPIGREEAKAMISAYLASHPAPEADRPMTPAQARAARVGLGITVDGLALALNIAPARIANFEANVNMDPRIGRKIAQAFEARGVGFMTQCGVQAVLLPV